MSGCAHENQRVDRLSRGIRIRFSGIQNFVAPLLNCRRHLHRHGAGDEFGVGVRFPQNVASILDHNCSLFFERTQSFAVKYR